jgi:hypothetical protein
MSNYSRRKSNKTGIIGGVFTVIVAVLSVLLFGVLMLSGVAAIFGFLTMLAWNGIVSPNLGFSQYPFTFFFALYFIVGLVLMYVNNGRNK